MVAGIVLCGGMSRRMGRDKASLPFGHETLLERVVRRLPASPIVVVAAPDQIVPSSMTVVRDPVAGRGPWLGISAGLRHVNQLAFVTSCDAPFLAPRWIERLLERLGDYDCVVPVQGDILQPLTALYRPAAADVIDRLLNENARPLKLFDLVKTCRIDVEEFRDIDPGQRTLWNLNTPNDYQAALDEV